MGAGTVVWSGTFTMPASGPGVASSVAVSLAALNADDRVVATPSSTAIQTGWKDVNGPFKVQIVKSAGVGFTAYADRSQFPSNTTYDYIVLTNST